MSSPFFIHWWECARWRAVEIATDGREALHKSREGKFDLILMDVQMPEFDGLETTGAIRELEKATGKHLPIVAMTAYALSGDRERCLKAGMDGYISKPFRLQELLAQLEKLSLEPEARKRAVTARQDHRGIQGDKENALEGERTPTFFTN